MGPESSSEARTRRIWAVCALAFPRLDDQELGPIEGSHEQLASVSDGALAF